ncbi:Dipeptidyl aminopeptidase/acylaminoacyl peptidase [Halobiforma haloterrestris]|uniref:Dipeptidyl aminopeptidase/acylaminoacyl peptidase n=1 Tax=Natronobacterium haloterrestre TaxID=148448 RepID=A0A1I1L9K3_NATHA|nr:prolyl oligopeptidase family serine peptidase [Halobiforma haloterrestris]SFC69676.1 Dipeptidyl aminopeptidase/acylaminoacyl peptidase [Halobiforma haloterrestris]
MNDSATVDDPLEALAALPTLCRPTVSPSGDRVALYYDDTGRNELHVLDVTTGNRRQWSDGNVPRDGNAPLGWAADGDRVLVHIDDAGDEQYDIYAMDATGSLDPVVRSDGKNELCAIAPDGSFVVVNSTRNGQMNLYRHGLEEGGETALTDHSRTVWRAVLGPDGDRIAYVTDETGDPMNLDTYVMDADGTNSWNVQCGTTGSQTTVADWGPEGERLLLGDDSDGRTRPGVYDLETSETTWLGDGTYEETPIQFHPEGDEVFVLRDRDGMTVPVVYDTSGDDPVTDRELSLPDGVTFFSATIRPERRHVNDAVLADGRVLLSHKSSTTRSSLLAYDLSTDDVETLLEPAYGPFSPTEFTDSTYFTFRSDGVPDTPQRAVEHDPYEELDIGALLYDSGERPSPLVVKPHGGPRGRDAKRFSTLTQLLVSRGFSVLEVNYRGSVGRGREFIERLYDDFGGAEQGDIATGVQHVLEAHEWIDDERIAVTGGSYGGYSTYWQLVQYPDLYDAGVAMMGITDWVVNYEDTMPHYRTGLLERYLGTPEENEALYRERSPITHVTNLDAPLLVLHGVNDPRVPVSQARVFREALLEEGYDQGETGDFEYRELRKEGHATTDRSQRRRMYRILDGFLRRRLDVS